MFMVYGRTSESDMEEVRDDRVGRVRGSVSVNTDVRLASNVKVELCTLAFRR